MKVFMVKDKVKTFLIVLIGIVFTAYYFDFHNGSDEVEREQVSELKASSSSEKVFFNAPKRIAISPPITASSSSASNK